MNSPLNRDVIAANGIAVSTGLVAKHSGKSGIESFNVGMAWRWWYKNMTMANILLVILVIFAGNTGQWIYVVAQVVINTLVCAITYCKLVAVSGFRQRLAFHICWPLAKHFPYTSRLWFYFLLLLPAWTAMWLHVHNYQGTGALTW